MLRPAKTARRYASGLPAIASQAQVAPSSQASWHTLLVGMVLVLCAGALDALTLARMVETSGPAMEANPLMRTVLEHAGVTAVLALKALGTLGVCLMVARLARWQRHGHAWAVVTAALVCWLFGALTNVL